MSVSWPLKRSYLAPQAVLRGRVFAWGTRTYVMGIINVTPDSFSGDGLAGDVPAAVALAQAFEAAGADILDIGGESSRPGAAPVTPQEEAARVIPAFRAIREAVTLPMSIDTYHAGVAEAACCAGADLINDIHGFRFDARMADVAARQGVGAVAMHNQRGRTFHDVIGDIRAGFETTLEIAQAAGVQRSSLILDPGFGFGWRPEHNLEMLRRLPELWDYNLPLLTGTSRKSTLGVILNTAVEERLEGSAATVALSIAAGADLVRVHDVREMVRVARVTDAVVRAAT